MSNSGPCPDSHTLPPGSRPLSLPLPTPTSAWSLWMAPNLTLTLWDPHVLCLSWRGMGLSPLTHPGDGPPHAGYSACAHAHTVCCICAHGHEGAGVPGSACRGPGSLALLPGSACPLGRSEVCEGFVHPPGACVLGGDKHTGTGHHRGILRHQLLLASPPPVALRFARSEEAQ